MFCATRTAFRITIRILKRYLLILKQTIYVRQIIFSPFFLLILMGCSDDKNIPDIPASTEDTYEGVHDLISFTKETEDFTYGDLTFYIKTPRGNIIQRKAKHRRLSGTSLFTMEKAEGG